ncbi:hypothetical protein PspLS_05896 [Pyricularia sp. CBS 133598]|nr:hypothetical protein PspLS_05896 [Pyricularia sp. CBS 133598]
MNFPELSSVLPHGSPVHGKLVLIVPGAGGLQPGQTIPAGMLREPPRIVVDGMGGANEGGFTLLMVSMNNMAPIPGAQALHWLVHNVTIRDGFVDVQQGEILAPYMPPNMGPGLGPRPSCTFVLIKNMQNQSSDSIRGKYNISMGPVDVSARMGFKPRDFIEEQGDAVAATLLYTE